MKAHVNLRLNSPKEAAKRSRRTGQLAASLGIALCFACALASLFLWHATLVAHSDQGRRVLSSLPTCPPQAFHGLTGDLDATVTYDVGRNGKLTFFNQAHQECKWTGGPVEQGPGYGATASPK